MAYKCANNLAPEYLCVKFKKRSSVHNRTTRNNDKFEIPSFRSATGQRTFAYIEQYTMEARSGQNNAFIFQLCMN